MSKEDLEEERYKLEGMSFIDTKTNMCLNFGKKDLIRVCNQLNYQEEFLKDYEKQIEQLKAENERLKERVGIATLHSKEDYMDRFMHATKEVIILEQQLKEKDEEIEQLKGDYDLLKKTYQGTCITYKDDHDTLIKLLKSNTKQVCEKIRKKGEITHPYNARINSSDEVLVIKVKDLVQIEKGENDE